MGGVSSPFGSLDNAVWFVGGEGAGDCERRQGLVWVSRGPMGK